jgi:hypothetical protein
MFSGEQYLVSLDKRRFRVRLGEVLQLEAAWGHFDRSTIDIANIKLDRERGAFGPKIHQSLPIATGQDEAAYQCLSSYP